MAVLLNKEPCVVETVNDLHGELINLARVVRDEDLAPALFDRMTRTMMHEDLMHEAAAKYKAEGDTPATAVPDLERAANYLLCAWLGRNGVAGTSSYNQGFCVRYTANGGHAAKRFRSMVESIPAWWERLRNVTILNRNARGLLEKIDDVAGTVVYLDPPYVEKDAKYVYDFAAVSEASLFGGEADDEARMMSHRELAGLASRFTNARVIISYYDHPLIRELYQAWTFVDCTMRKSLVNQGMRMRGDAAAEAPEVLIINGPSFTEKA